MKIQLLRFFFVAGMLLTLLGFDAKKCDSKLSLKETKESSFVVSIETVGTFTAEMFYIEGGEYISQESKSGSGNSLVEFANIEKGTIYKIVVEYSDSNPLCETKQLSGLKL